MTAFLIGLAVVGVLDTLLRLPYLRNLPEWSHRLLTILLALGGLYWGTPLDVLAAIGIVVVLEMLLTQQREQPVGSMDYRTDLQGKPPRVPPLP